MIRRGKEPLYAVYPVDGIVMADSPLGAIDRGEDRKMAFFRKLRDRLLSKEIRQEILKIENDLRQKLLQAKEGSSDPPGGD